MRVIERRCGRRGARGPLAAALVGAAGLFALGCGPEVRPTGPATTSGGSPSAAVAGRGPVADDAALEARRLEKTWDAYLGERIAGLWQIDDAIYVLTEPNRLWAIGLEDGLVRWQYNVPDGLSYPPTAYAYEEADRLGRTDELFLISQDVLHVVDLQHGFLLWKKRLPFAAASPAVGGLGHVYIGAWDDRIYAIGKEERAGQHHVAWSYRTGAAVTAEAEVPERSVETVFVGSEDGSLYAMSPSHEERKWHLDTRGRLRAAPLYFRQHVYVASTDMTFYCVRAVDGNVEWKYPAGAPLSSPPVAYTGEEAVSGGRVQARHTLYLRADDGRLLALNLRPDVAGEYQRWHAEGIDRVLAHGRGDVYALDAQGRVVAFNEQTGAPRWEQPLGVGAGFYAQNPYSTNSSRQRERDLSTIMTFGYKNGWIVAIKEKGEY